MKKLFFILLSIVVFAGCSTFKDISKNTMGVSMRDLEAGKADSIYQVYSCDMGACFDAVADIARKNQYYVFMKDEIRGFIVLMNIPGCVDTTEVGVFFTELPNRQGVKLELSSRSSPAKRTVAKVLFSALNDQFKK
jgi:hypothetical protein